MKAKASAKATKPTAKGSYTTALAKARTALNQAAESVRRATREGSAKDKISRLEEVRTLRQSCLGVKSEFEARIARVSRKDPIRGLLEQLKKSQAELQKKYDAQNLECNKALKASEESLKTQLSKLAV